jgi:hypothetical protein
VGVAGVVCRWRWRVLGFGEVSSVEQDFEGNSKFLKKNVIKSVFGALCIWLVINCSKKVKNKIFLAKSACFVVK